MNWTARSLYAGAALAGAAMLAALLVACSGGTGGGLGLTPPAPGAPGGGPTHRRRGQAQIMIRIPMRKRGRAKYISPSTHSMTVAVKGQPLQVFNLIPQASGCTITSPSGDLTCSENAFFPAGKQMITITLYDQIKGKGQQLSTASTSVNIASGGVTRISIALNGVVATAQALLDGSADAAIPAGIATSVPVSVTAYDADKNIIMSPGNYSSPVKLSDSDTSGATSLTRTSITKPGATVTLKYDGGTLSSATITPSVNGTPQTSGTATLTLATGPTITEYTLPGNTFPAAITSGPGGALWFAEFGGNGIGKITTSGAVTSYAAAGGPYDIAASGSGSSGTVWFTAYNGNAVGEASVSGSTPSIKEYSLTAGSSPKGIAIGPDGAAWFTECASNQIGRIASGGTVTEYSIPAASSLPAGIAAGPDDALWFTENGSKGNAIGRISTTGTFTSYTLPVAHSAPNWITAGPDGALWFTECLNNAIGRITTTGTITEYSIPTPFSFPQGITTGPDGAIWFIEAAGNNIGRITTTGTITEYSIPTSGSAPEGITTGPDGAIWFTECGASKIGRLTGISPSQRRSRAPVRPVR